MNDLLLLLNNMNNCEEAISVKRVLRQHMNPWRVWCGLSSQHTQHVVTTSPDSVYTRHHCMCTHVSQWQGSSHLTTKPQLPQLSPPPPPRVAVSQRISGFIAVISRRAGKHWLAAPRYCSRIDQNAPQPVLPQLSLTSVPPLG